MSSYAVMSHLEARLVDELTLLFPCSFSTSCYSNITSKFHYVYFFCLSYFLALERVVEILPHAFMAVCCRSCEIEHMGSKNWRIDKTRVKCSSLHGHRQRLRWSSILYFTKSTYQKKYLSSVLSHWIGYHFSSVGHHLCIEYMYLGSSCLKNHFHAFFPL